MATKVSKLTMGAAIGLAAGMIITGSINTLSTSWANRQWTRQAHQCICWQMRIGTDPVLLSACCFASDTWSTGRYGLHIQFNHPFFQAVGMFLGESLCLPCSLTIRPARAECVDGAGDD